MFDERKGLGLWQMIYWVFLCNKCSTKKGRKVWSVQSSNAAKWKDLVLCCKYCGKSRKAKYSCELGLNFELDVTMFGPLNARQASFKCGFLNKKG